MLGALIGLAAKALPFFKSPFGAGALMGLGGGILGATPTTVRGSKEEEESRTTRQTPIEDPTFAAFRLALIPEFWEAMSRAKAPVYGAAERAAAIQQANEAYAKALEGVKESLGRLGVRGDLVSAASALEAERAGQIAEFLNSLPMLERQAYLNAVGSLLGQGMQFAGKAPVGMEEVMNRLARGSFTQKSSAGLGGSLLGNLLSGFGMGGLLSGTKGG